MSDETIITAKEIEVVEKVEEKNEEVVANVQEEDINTNVDSTNEDSITSDKDKKTPALQSKKKTVQKRATSSLSEILYTIKQNISGLYMYGFVLYDGFTCGMTNCPGTIFFFIFGLLNTLSFVYLILRSKAKVKRRIKKMSTPTFKSKNPFQRILKMYYTRFGLHGKYYLYKLYGSEMLEKISQTYNYIYIYIYMHFTI